MSLFASGLMTIAALTGSLPSVCSLGQWQPATTAAALGMGGSDYTSVSALGALENPAIMGLGGPDGLRLDGAGLAVIGYEKRLRKVYDQFGSSIGESETAFNRDLALLPGGIGGWLAGGGLPRNLSLAAGVRAPASFRYRYDRILRNSAYVETGTERLEIDGSELEMALSGAFSPSPRVTIGLGGGYITGTRETVWEKTWVDPTEPDVLTKTSEDISGMVARGSALVNLGRVRLTAGAEALLSYEFEGDSTVSVDLPPTIRGGLVYVPGNRLLSNFVAEGYYSTTSDAEVDGEPLYDRDSWGISAGVENDLPGGPVARFGFRYDASPLSRSLDATTFTAGLGLEAGPWNIDLGGSFTPQRWRQTELPGLPSFPAGDSLQVEESSTRVMLSVSRAVGI